MGLDFEGLYLILSDECLVFLVLIHAFAALTQNIIKLLVMRMVV